MAKTNITLYSSTPSSNTDINNINIDENCPASGLNNAIRELMAHLKNVDTGSQALTALSVTGDTTISSGNLLVGKTSSGVANDGFEAQSTGQTIITQASADVLRLNRKTSDGTIIDLRKDGSTVGSIGVDNSDNLFISGNSSHAGFEFGSTSIVSYKNGTSPDNTISLGGGAQRFKDLYLGGGVYLGGTGSANKLEDYEEGTWTPTYSPSVGSFTTVPYDPATSGIYTKIGDTVHIVARVRTDATIVLGTASGTLNIGGLPFTATGNASFTVWSRDFGGDNPSYGLVGSTLIALYYRTSANGTADNNLNVTDLNTGSNNQNDVIVSGWYKVA